MREECIEQADIKEGGEKPVEYSSDEVIWRRRGGVPETRILLDRGHLAERVRHPLIAGVLECIEATNYEATRDLVPDVGYLLKA